MTVDLGIAEMDGPCFGCLQLSQSRLWHFSTGSFRNYSSLACLCVNETRSEMCKAYLCDFVLDLVRGNRILKSDSEPQFSLVQWGCNNSLFSAIPVDFWGGS